MRFFRFFARRGGAVEPPVRAELFGIERLEQHAESLAAAQPVGKARGGGHSILGRVSENSRVLRQAHSVLSEEVRAHRPVTPAAEWLIENFHVVDEQLREIRDDLPSGFYRELPKLVAGPFTGYPRVYGIAWAFVAHTDSRFDPDSLRRFVAAYQRVQPLTIGELWAVAITLRIVLVENLRRLADRLVTDQAARRRADTLADMLLGISDAANIAPLLRQHEDAAPVPAFAVRLMQRVRGNDAAPLAVGDWLRRHLPKEQADAEAVVQHEMQTQAAATVTARNVITSMRLMSALDWAEFFERVSLVDEMLRARSDFAAMDFQSRDSYRHAIELLARRSRRDELEVTRLVLDRCVPDGAGPPGDPRTDPGYCLVGDGRRAFERAIGFRAPFAERLLRAYRRGGTAGYLGTIVVLAIAALALPLWAARDAGAGVGTLVLLGILALAPASDLAVALTNRWVALIVTPRLLPRLELRDGIPAELRTIVVIPTLVPDVHAVDDQLDQLEVHYLANPDDQLQFALVSDFTDADAESLPTDEQILGAARRGVARLNARHGKASDGRDRFLLLHRRRQWNPRERKWIGWERKRGKLRELNHLLRGARDTSFLVEGGDGGVAAGTRFVVALDADTRLPIASVRELVGTLVHPLNRAHFDPAAARVVRGYGILQPRVTATLPLGEGSLYHQVISGAAGIDPYAAAVSDVYQDLFHAGSYIGKGIYDIDAFEASLDARVPENTLLSHDLFEGIFARTALVTDISLFEPTPSHYLVAAARQHRWARGDWQLLPFIFRFAMPGIDRWKMLDNLRRTLSAPGALLTLVVSWLRPLDAPLAWTVLVLAAFAVPALLPTLSGLIPHGRGISKRAHVRAIVRDFTLGASQLVLTVTLLAHQAWLMTDAAVRTLYRLLISRRHLLQWVTAAQAEAGLRLRMDVFVRYMWSAVVIGIVAAALVTRLHPAAWPLALSFVVLWIASPAIAHGVSVPQPVEPRRPLTDSDVRTLRMVARRTWRFFETFVSDSDRHLPPDNFQETPAPVVAHRTSPTNIGLYLLSAVAANDFGWLGVLDTIARLEATFDAMATLDRLHGHFFNWYDTTDGRPLEPRYLSSVDSGNLAGALIALAGACEELLTRPLLEGNVFSGLQDTLLVVEDEVVQGNPAALTEPARRLRSQVRRLLRTAQRPLDTGEWLERLTALERGLDDLATLAHPGGAAAPPTVPTIVNEWIAEAQRQLASHERDVDLLAPWARRAGPRPPGGVQQLAIWRTPIVRLDRVARATVERLTAVRAELAAQANTPPATLHDLDAEIEALGGSAAAAAELVRRISRIAVHARALAAEMDFRFLFDPVRKLFAIGYRVGDNALDGSQYDLLASESRLTSFVAIAKGDVPVSHWFHLGRALTPVGRNSVLISWSGSMFEYLMPSLVMQAPEGGLIDQTCRLVVRRQMAYGAERGVPWGISESAYSVRDIEMTYQYSTFGVPGLGLRRQLADDLVIAPYATGLAAMIDPDSAAANFRRLAEAGASGAYGMYESLDYTPQRVPAGSRAVVVRTYMAHHQGMMLLGIADALHHGAMRRRFHAEPMIRASELLLQERTPRDVPVARPPAENLPDDRVPSTATPVSRTFASPYTASPRVALLSNGRYSVMLTAAGSGYSRWNDLAVTRWRGDTTCDGSGSYIYCRDVGTGAVWSAAHQPCGVDADDYQAEFTEDHTEFRRRDGAFVTRMEVLVSAEDDAEVRRITLTNASLRTRDIEVTSYAEVVLAPQNADVVHPAFSNLFVSTAPVPGHDMVLAWRRPRSADERDVFLAHVVAVDGDAVGGVEWSTDRAAFIGRNGTLRQPRAVGPGIALDNSAGSVLDPIVALRRRVRVRPGQHATLVFSTLVGETREQLLDVADRYRDPAIFERVAALAWTQAQVQLHHLGVSADEAQLFQVLAGPLLYPDRSLRAPPELLARPEIGRSVVWAHGVSGDLPIVVIQIDEPDDVSLVRQMLRAHEYWRMKRLAVDVVILNERGPSYVQDLQHELEGLIRSARAAPAGDPHGSVYLIRADLLQGGDRETLLGIARVVLTARRGGLAEQLVRLSRAAAAPLPAARPPVPASGELPLPSGLEFFNGIGGFDRGGQEYLVALRGNATTPAPWINVVANADAGFQVSESGAGYTWSINSQENQLSAWSNDPVRDPPSQVFYLRDEDTGQIWTPTAAPIRVPDATYLAHHGAGYSVFEHVSHSVASELTEFVPRDGPVKISQLRLVNRAARPRRLTVTAYLEWTLGVAREAMAPYVVTELDSASGVMLARNGWNADFRERVAFVDLYGADAWTGDRTEFLGRNGSLERPAALQRQMPLSRRTGAGFDPCAVLQRSIVLPPGANVLVECVVGEGTNRADAIAIAGRYRNADRGQLLRDIRAFWDGLLGTVEVRTPDRSIDLLLNRWLLYQTLACRVWARAAFYQVSGAYGFRDQLQDVAALVVAAPDIARAHIIRAAGRQFPEGDVQHWWHPTTGRGIRTRISDDLLWLPYIASHYIEVTGDRTLLDELVPFLDGPRLAPNELECYFEPRVSSERVSVYEHAARTIDRSRAVGEHGLPLMGTGDWNDGMNRVGVHGRGESVWLAWFLANVIQRWAPIAEARGDSARAATWRQHVESLRSALDEHAWDGDWYRRAYFDDGTPLGTHTATECRIDAIAQSWSVMSGLAPLARARTAMQSLDRLLVRPEDRLHLLLTPPFDQTPLDPGYIKGYLPGVRENGGQYTHAAIWSIVAWTMLGDGDKAGALFDLLNPIRHAARPGDVERYKVEPFVVAGDVYSEPPHTGRGGWTWYSGSAGWLYRAGLEFMLGFRLAGDRLRIDPCIPTAWDSFRIALRRGAVQYDVVVENPEHVSRGVRRVEVDGVDVPPADGIALRRDGAVHHVRVTLGAPS